MLSGILQRFDLCMRTACLLSEPLPNDLPIRPDNDTANTRVRI